MYRHKCIINRLRIFNISQPTHTMHNWGIANLIVWTSQIRCRCSSRRCFSVRGLKMIVAHNYGSKCNLDRLCCRFCIASPFVVADIKVVTTAAATVVTAAETVENSCWLPQLFFHCRSRLSVSIRQSSVSSPQPTPVLQVTPSSVETQPASSSTCFLFLPCLPSSAPFCSMRPLIFFF